MSRSDLGRGSRKSGLVCSNRALFRPKPALARANKFCFATDEFPFHANQFSFDPNASSFTSDEVSFASDEFSFGAIQFSFVWISSIWASASALLLRTSSLLGQTSPLVTRTSSLLSEMRRGRRGKARNLAFVRRNFSDFMGGERFGWPGFASCFFPAHDARKFQPQRAVASIRPQP